MQDNPKTNQPQAGFDTTPTSWLPLAASMVSSAMSRTNLTSAASNAYRQMGYPTEFAAALQQGIEESSRSGTPGALMLFSIDNLSMIMSGYGHTICEATLRQIERDIIDMIGSEDQIYRIQRDQYGIILSRANIDEITYLAGRITSHIRQFGSANPNSSLHVTCSVVSVCFPEQASTMQDVLDHCFIAMQERVSEYAVRSFDTYADRAAYSRQEMGLANYLHKAMQEKRLKLAFQPIIHAKTGQISHYEALLRLCGHDGTISSAGALIPIAERMGLIDTIDEYVLRLVVEELRRDPNVQMAFNISNLTTRNSDWLEVFSNLIEETPAIAPRLIVEITETAAQRDLRQTAFFVAQIQSFGALVALDDFGSGYTSFRQLKALSVDMVKIDGAFVKDLVDNADNRFFVKTLLDFTNAFGLKSVAEFVENGEIAKMLMELGVEYLQGYYFGRPENHRSWLKDGEYEGE
jgi:diguanylate cyclase (GGDEF)-like protein